MKIIVAYVPVFHEGYRQFFLRHTDAEELYVLGADVLREFDYLRKDIRALSPPVAAMAVGDLGFFKSVSVASRDHLGKIARDQMSIVMPDEEESRLVAEKYFKSCSVVFDRSIFLRWDRKKVLAEEEVRFDRVVPFDGFVAEIMGLAQAQAELATNLWRRVGAVVVRDTEVLLVAHNTQVPSPCTPYFEGDPRMFFKQGLYYELTTDEHAEARLVAEAASDGIALRGSDMFVTPFPCPPCAKLVARAKFRRMYFASGYSKLDGERIIRDAGIEIIQVETKTPIAYAKR